MGRGRGAAVAVAGPRAGQGARPRLDGTACGIGACARPWCFLPAPASRARGPGRRGGAPDDRSAADPGGGGRARPAARRRPRAHAPPAHRARGADDPAPGDGGRGRRWSTASPSGRTARPWTPPAIWSNRPVHDRLQAEAPVVIDYAGLGGGLPQPAPAAEPGMGLRARPAGPRAAQHLRLRPGGLVVRPDGGVGYAFGDGALLAGDPAPRLHGGIDAMVEAARAATPFAATQPVPVPASSVDGGPAIAGAAAVIPPLGATVARPRHAHRPGVRRPAGPGRARPPRRPRPDRGPALRRRRRSPRPGDAAEPAPGRPRRHGGGTPTPGSRACPAPRRAAPSCPGSWGWSSPPWR